MFLVVGIVLSGLSCWFGFDVGLYTLVWLVACFWLLDSLVERSWWV